ncbi:MAG: enoyl-CoA hydratase/isomerase family protein [Candidatus Kariarchaeaceae archaeon]|jgi:2-(1,2-epoxy-1,2-dihydrophenyl)acetyl-CoA isomerase
MAEILATKDNDRRVLLLEMNNRANSFTKELLTTLETWLDKAALDTQLHSIILTGRGSIFSVGGDIKQMKIDLDQGRPEAYIERIVPIINSIIKKMITHPLMIIAAVNGSAAGAGLSLALFCDHIIAVPDAKLAFAFSSLDLTPDSGSIISFVRSFGYTKTVSGLLTSKTMTGQEAYDLGAINQLSDSKSLIGKAKHFAAKLQSVSRETITHTKALLNSSLTESIDAILKIEYDAIYTASKKPAFAKRLNNMLSALSKP